MNASRVRSNTRPRSRTSEHESGIALVETLVALVIFSFGLLGLMGLAARAINFSVNADDRNRAAMFASDIASTMWTLGTVNVPGTTLSAWQAAVHDTSNAGVPSGTLLIAPIAGANSADITITWRATTARPTDPANQLTTRVILP